MRTLWKLSCAWRDPDLSIRLPCALGYLYLEIYLRTTFYYGNPFLMNLYFISLQKLG